MKTRLFLVLACLWLVAGYALWVGVQPSYSSTGVPVPSVSRPIDGHEFDDIFARQTVSRKHKADRLVVPVKVAPIYRGPHFFFQSVLA